MNIPFPLSLRQEFYDHALSVYPKEACGLFALKSQTLIVADNLADDPINNFIVSPQLLEKVVAEEDGQIAIAHSHTNGNPRFSSQDIQCAKEIGEHDWYLISISDLTKDLNDAAEDYLDISEVNAAPYLGRKWRYGWLDCFALCRDWLKREKGIGIDDFPRGEEFEWQKTEFRMFEENIKSQGFIKIQDDSYKAGDFLLFQLQGSPNANHIGVLIDSEKLTFLHHLYGQLSSRDILGGYWSKTCISQWRHIKLIAETNANQN